MASKEFNCPSCGSLLKLEYRFSEMVVCKYCDQTSHVVENALEAQGEKVKLADYGTKFFVGAEGVVLEKEFKVLGRIRFKYHGGFWDEWLIQVGDEFTQEFWLQEDEGDLTLFEKSDRLPDINEFDKLEVGVKYAFGEKQIFISEKNKAKIVGGEGELPHRVTPGEKADFVDGIIYGEGIQTSFEFMPKDKQFYISKQSVKLEDFKFNKNSNQDVY